MSVIHHPSILRDVISGKNSEEIRAKVRSLDVKGRGLGKEIPEFISYLKRTSPYDINPKDKPKLNRLCYVEDSENSEVREILSSLQLDFSRRSWEYALAIIAMRRFGKLNNNSKAIGIASAKEALLFYLANHVNHVYATDLYDSTKDRNAPSESLDIAFSISSIEHFGGKNHSGALGSLKEIERVLKAGGISVITTEYIVNDKEHPEFFNGRTIYDDLINKLQKLQLVEPLDLRITTRTLDTATGQYDNIYPHILLRYGDILFTSVMLVFQKQ